MQEGVGDCRSVVTCLAVVSSLLLPPHPSAQQPTRLSLRTPYSHATGWSPSLLESHFSSSQSLPTLQYVWWWPKMEERGRARPQGSSGAPSLCPPCLISPQFDFINTAEFTDNGFMMRLKYALFSMWRAHTLTVVLGTSGYTSSF